MAMMSQDSIIIVLKSLGSGGVLTVGEIRDTTNLSYGSIRRVCRKLYLAGIIDRNIMGQKKIEYNVRHFKEWNKE